MSGGDSLWGEGQLRQWRPSCPPPSAGVSTPQPFGSRLAQVVAKCSTLSPKLPARGVSHTSSMANATFEMVASNLAVSEAGLLAATDLYTEQGEPGKKGPPAARVRWAGWRVGLGALLAAALVGVAARAAAQQRGQAPALTKDVPEATELQDCGSNPACQYEPATGGCDCTPSAGSSATYPTPITDCGPNPACQCNPDTGGCDCTPR
ncbi:unnamed protein product [Prorocentrum cordatum]|uniref:Uncharacterized protein n=1 Tax=Prorocentrum cordatum TaxID=2364126 RepID=A0ABN9TC87_9DINO|nr:unnamed protein product [Polarella glacialis]